MVAGLIKKKDKVKVVPKPVRKITKPSKPQPGFDGNIKGHKPSAASIQAEEDFENIMKAGGYEAPVFTTFGVQWLKNILCSILDRQDMWEKVVAGKVTSHGTSKFKNIEEALDFLLGVDCTFKVGSLVYGFDITRNSKEENIDNKKRKVTKAFRGGRKDLFEELGYDGYVVIVWKVRKSQLDRGDIANLQQQLIDGIKTINGFAGAITLEL